MAKALKRWNVKQEIVAVKEGLLEKGGVCQLMRKHCETTGVCQVAEQSSGHKVLIIWLATDNKSCWQETSNEKHQIMSEAIKLLLCLN